MRPPTAARVNPDRARRYLTLNTGDSRDLGHALRHWRPVGYTTDVPAAFTVPPTLAEMQAAMRAASATVADGVRNLAAMTWVDVTNAGYVGIPKADLRAHQKAVERAGHEPPRARDVEVPGEVRDAARQEPWAQ